VGKPVNDTSVVASNPAEPLVFQSLLKIYATEGIDSIAQFSVRCLLVSFGNNQRRLWAKSAGMAVGIHTFNHRRLSRV
jgi:hypothetical protein